MNNAVSYTCRNVFSILTLFLYFLMDPATVHGQAERNVFIYPECWIISGSHLTAFKLSMKGYQRSKLI